MAIEKGISSISSAESASLKLGDGEIKDIKIFGGTVYVLWLAKGRLIRHYTSKSNANLITGTTSLLSIPYKNSKPSNGIDVFEVEYLPYNTQSNTRITTLTNDEVTRQFKKFGIPGDDRSFVPEKIQVRESKSRNGDDSTGRIVLLSQNRKYYKVCRLVRGDAHGEEDDEDVAMSQDSP